AQRCLTTTTTATWTSFLFKVPYLRLARKQAQRCFHGAKHKSPAEDSLETTSRKQERFALSTSLRKPESLRPAMAWGRRLAILTMMVGAIFTSLILVLTRCFSTKATAHLSM